MESISQEQVPGGFQPLKSSSMLSFILRHVSDSSGERLWVSRESEYCEDLGALERQQ
jgi:hypothetical protein